MGHSPQEQWSTVEYRAYVSSGGKTKPVAPAKPASAVTPLPPAKSPLATRFENMWASLNGPEYEVEHPVCSDRKWRLDYFWPCGVFLELQGGIYLAGRGGHVAPKRFQNDCDKWNQCSRQGWVGFKLATGQVTPENVAMIRDYLKQKTR